MTKNRGYRNRAERIADLNDKAAKIWSSTYVKALGWSPDPEGDAHRAMSNFLAKHHVD